MISLNNRQELVQLQTSARLQWILRPPEIPLLLTQLGRKIDKPGKIAKCCATGSCHSAAIFQAPENPFRPFYGKPLTDSSLVVPARHGFSVGLVKIWSM
jgi:hypothetical protein